MEHLELKPFQNVIVFFCPEGNQKIEGHRLAQATKNQAGKTSLFAISESANMRFDCHDFADFTTKTKAYGWACDEIYWDKSGYNGIGLI